MEHPVWLVPGLGVSSTVVLLLFGKLSNRRRVDNRKVGGWFREQSFRMARVQHYPYYEVDMEN